MAAAWAWANGRASLDFVFVLHGKMASGALDSPKSSAARADERAPYGRGGGAMIRCGEARQKGGRFARENGLRRPRLAKIFRCAG